MDVEAASSEDHKRKGPDSRTVVLAPEKKRQRYEFETHDMFFARTLWWMMQRPRMIRLEPHYSWYEHEVRWMCKRRSRTTSIPERLLLHLHCRTKVCLKSSEIFRVDEETDVLTEDKLYKHWNEFEESDKSELKQFIDEKVFRKVKLGTEVQETPIWKFEGEISSLRQGLS